MNANSSDRSSQLSQTMQAEPDMRAVCEALGFDPTNHHNAAKCPYCRPVTPQAETASTKEGEAEWKFNALYADTEVRIVSDDKLIAVVHAGSEQRRIIAALKAAQRATGPACTCCGCGGCKTCLGGRKPCLKHSPRPATPEPDDTPLETGEADAR